MSETIAPPRSTRRHKSQSVISRVCTLVMIAGSPACADLLDIRNGLSSPVGCQSDLECAPLQSCESGRCFEQRCSNEGTKVCQGLVVARCEADGTWLPYQVCDAICSDGECKPPRSCSHNNLTCDSETSCCKSIVLAGDTYELRYAYPDPASDTRSDELEAGVTRSVRTFALDRFEVSVSRFLEFIWAYEQDGHPAEGAGAHPAFPDSGWQTKWSDDHKLLPGDQSALEYVLNQNQQPTLNPERRTLPVRGVNWYIAFAFCIWDGGRLPTEAEWSYVAVGGAESRTYPWPNTDLGPPINHSDAQYSDDELASDGPDVVGAHPAGQALRGHDDLAGNLKEWVADVYQERMEVACKQPGDLTDEDNECMQRDGSDLRVIRGGSYFDNTRELRNVHRSYDSANMARPWFGFRCARDLAER